MSCRSIADQVSIKSFIKFLVDMVSDQSPACKIEMFANAHNEPSGNVLFYLNR